MGFYHRGYVYTAGDYIYFEKWSLTGELKASISCSTWMIPYWIRPNGDNLFHLGKFQITFWDLDLNPIHQISIDHEPKTYIWHNSSFIYYHTSSVFGVYNISTNECNYTNIYTKYDRAYLVGNYIVLVADKKLYVYDKVKLTLIHEYDRIGLKSLAEGPDYLLQIEENCARKFWPETGYEPTKSIRTDLSGNVYIIQGEFLYVRILKYDILVLKEDLDRWRLIRIVNINKPETPNIISVLDRVWYGSNKYAQPYCLKYERLSEFSEEWQKQVIYSIWVFTALSSARSCSIYYSKHVLGLVFCQSKLIDAGHIIIRCLVLNAQTNFHLGN